MKIIWLASWYPNQIHPFEGDFIQRHAEAVTLYESVHVIYVGITSASLSGKDYLKSKNANPQLSEQVILLSAKSGIIGKLKGALQWYNSFKHWVEVYIEQKGKPDIVHVQVPYKAGLIALWIKRRYKIPYVITEHWGIYNSIVEDCYSRRGAIFKWLTRRIFKKADGFLSVSKYLAQKVSEQVIEKRYSVLPNVVNTDIFYFQPRPKSTLFRFLHVSDMGTVKNVKGIVNAFSLLNDINTELIFVGDKTETSAAIYKQAELTGLLNKRIFFRGVMAYNGVAEEMRRSHALVHFSRMENSPCVIGEALCCGLPVIAASIGGVPELLTPSNALLIESGNENALVAAMRKLKEEYTRFDRIRIAAEASNKFSMQTIGAKTIQFYKAILKKNGSMIL